MHQHPWRQSLEQHSRLVGVIVDFDVFDVAIVVVFVESLHYRTH